MSFPSATTELPSLSEWQLSYGGLAFGGVAHGATYQLQELPEGLDTPDYVSGDTQRALDDGEYPGLDLSPGRNVAVKQIIQAPTAKALAEAREALANVLGPKGSTEEPLFVQTPSGLFACMARPRKHKFSVGVSDVFAFGTVSTTMWHATDPRWYAMPTNSTAASPFVPGGLAYPFSYPATYAGSSGGVVSVVNPGGVPTSPLLRIIGPTKNPKVSAVSHPGAPFVEFELELAAGSQLVIDLDWETAVVTTVGSEEGSSRAADEAPGTTWFNCPGGTTTELHFSSETGEGTFSVEWASARLGL